MAVILSKLTDLWVLPPPDMTLRQYYAGQALAGLCANAERSRFSESIIALSAFRLADALIEAEAKNG